MRSRAHDRIKVHFPEYASARQHRELGASERCYLLHVETELGPHEFWIVDIAASPGGDSEVHDAGSVFADNASDPDGRLAIWDAMCSIEQMLREQRRA